MEVQQAPNERLADHLQEAARVLALPIEASGMHWHPFGVYTIPLAKREVDGVVRSRRLHIWHPEADPVGEASPYGVHTHSGPGTSHVLLGALEHHLYFFEEGPGPWRHVSTAGTQDMALASHVQATTRAGTTHAFPANQPHGVTKPAGWAVSLFEQGPGDGEFMTWQRQDVPAQPLDRRGPVPIAQVQQEARRLVDQALAAVNLAARN